MREGGANKSFVYVIGGKTGAQKIGITSNPVARQKALQHAASETLHCHGLYRVATDDARGIEGLAHWRLREARTHGEWFGVSVEEAVRTVGECVQRYGEGERAPRRIAGIGRPPIGAMAQFRMTEDMRSRIAAVVGPNRMATFIRKAIDAKLEREERKGADGEE